MKALLLCGSGADKSHTYILLTYLKTLLEDQKVECPLWNLVERPLPFALPAYHTNPADHPDTIVKEFVQTVEESQIIILGSPLYHGSYSGILKNALDNLRWDAFRGKWVGLTGNAGSIRAQHNELAHLRQVVNTLVGYCIQTDIATCKEDYTHTPEGYILENEQIKTRCERFVNELLSVTS